MARCDYAFRRQKEIVHGVSQGFDIFEGVKRAEDCHVAVPGDVVCILVLDGGYQSVQYVIFCA